MCFPVVAQIVFFSLEIEQVFHRSFRTDNRKRDLSLFKLLTAHRQCGVAAVPEHQPLKKS